LHWDRFKPKKEKTLWSYRELAGIFRWNPKVPAILVEELGRVVETMEISRRLSE